MRYKVYISKQNIIFKSLMIRVFYLYIVYTPLRTYNPIGIKDIPEELNPL